jgi:hypothetical protein
MLRDHVQHLSQHCDDGSGIDVFWERPVEYQSLHKELPEAVLIRGDLLMDSLEVLKSGDGWRDRDGVRV